MEEPQKPSWFDAPEWAKYLAQDEDGAWYWYEYEPKLGSEKWVIGELSGRYEAVKTGWRATLEQRPC